LADDTPKTPIATAMANSKLFPAAVNAMDALRSYDRPAFRPNQNEPNHMMAKYTSRGSAIRATSRGRSVIWSPWRAKSTTMVNRRP
jgi:hypothetical protein